MHTNVGGLTLRHFLILESVLSFNPEHIVAITESKLGTLDPDTPIAIDHYALLRHDRIDSRGGGIAIYILDSLSFKVLATSDVRDGTRVEFVLEEISSGRNSMLFCVVYLPPKKLAPRKFFDKLSLSSSLRQSSYHWRLQ